MGSNRLLFGASAGAAVVALRPFIGKSVEIRLADSPNDRHRGTLERIERLADDRDWLSLDSGWSAPVEDVWQVSVAENQKKEGDHHHDG